MKNKKNKINKMIMKLTKKRIKGNCANNGNENAYNSNSIMNNNG